MALAVNGSGTIFQKCDMSNHRPDSIKGRALNCQHRAIPRVLRARLDAALLGQRQTAREVVQGQEDPTTGRVDYGSGKKLARDWQLKLTVDKRSGDITFTDHSKSGKQNFGEACEQFIARMRVGENSRDRYRLVPDVRRGLFGDKTLAQVAQDRDGVTEL